MFVNDRLVFVELHKTGCTHIGKWFGRIVGGEQIGKHNRVPLELRDRFVIGSVRNPWDWYVSLWAYGCAGKGSVYRQTTRRLDLSYARSQLSSEMGRPRVDVKEALRQCLSDLRTPATKWRAAYSDASDPRAFRTWLRLMFDWDRRFDIGEGYGFSPVAKWAGLMTYRYLKLFTTLDDRLYTHPELGTETGSSLIWKRERLVSFVIQNERLETDVLAALAATGYTIPADMEQALHAARKTNTSSRLPAAHYYDEESIELIAQRESLVIKEHGYTPP
jgi:hypothetical protein